MEDKLKRALDVISKIAMVQDPDEKDPAWMDVYVLAHAFSGTCKNPHDGWKGTLEELEKKLENV